jgi:hypothetical protein
MPALKSGTPCKSQAPTLRRTGPPLLTNSKLILLTPAHGSRRWSKRGIGSTKRRGTSTGRGTPSVPIETELLKNKELGELKALQSSCHKVSILELADPRKNQGKVAVIALVLKFLIPRLEVIPTSTPEMMVVLVVPNQARMRMKMTIPKKKRAKDQLYLATNTGRVWLSSSPLLSRSTSITRIKCTICSQTIG